MVSPTYLINGEKSVGGGKGEEGGMKGEEEGGREEFLIIKNFHFF